jgi:hypothetical protein
MAKDVPQPDASTPQKPNIFQTVAAIVAGVVAVKLATYIVTAAWRLATRENPPQMDQDVGAMKKAAWLALIGAATGAARQTARDYIKPPTTGVA